MADQPHQCDVAVLTVIGPELHAVLNAFGLDEINHRKRFQGSLYWEAFVNSALLARPLRIVIHTIAEAGTDEASARATWLRDHFQPAAILLSGIAAGRRGKIKIGGVLVSRGVVDDTRQVALAGKMVRRVSAPPLAFPMKQMLAAFRINKTEFEKTAQKLFGRQLCAPKGFEAEFQEHVAMTATVTDGEVASANTLLRDGEVLERLSAEVHQGIKVGEMEASGVVRACNHGQTPIPWLVVRGVSDFGDDFKSDDFHEWASCTAAAYTKEFLENGFDFNLLRNEEPTSSVEKLDRLTGIGTDDAAFVQRDVGSGRTAVRLDDLYATRDLEAEVLDATKTTARRKKAPNQPIVIIGDAGEGKTSILWRLASRLRDEHGGRVFFLKGSSLRLDTDVPHGGLATAQEILEALTEVVRTHNRVFLLLDTLDLIVRDQAHRDALLLLVGRVEAVGCQLLATCRRQEFSFLSTVASSVKGSAVPVFLTFELSDYTEDEFREAVHRHVRRFYWDAGNSEAEQQAASLFEAVAAGRPVRELCFRPLTLRMLFTLYAPHKIPAEIHTFRLYSEFWTARVRDDRRAGAAEVAAAGINLEQPAALCALAMLAEGHVEVEESILQRILERFGCASESVAALVNRDVLHEDSQGRVRFFHQTFFEHAAARGLQLLGNDFAWTFAESRIRDPNDLFAAPVVEQWLLQNLANGLKPDRDLADHLTCSLLESDHINNQFSGIYVYAHASAELPKSALALRTLLDAEDDNGEIIKRYVSLLPNRAFRANESALDEIDRVWTREDWNLTLQVFRFLERYAGQRPVEVAHFLNVKSRLRGRLCDAKGDHYLWEVLRVARRIGASAPAWLWEVFVWMHNKQAKSSAKTDFIARLVELVCEHAVNYQEQFCSFFLKELPIRLQAQWKKVPSKAAAAYGLAWAKAWELQGLAVTEVLGRVAVASDADIRFALAGLAYFVSRRNDPSATQEVLDAFDKQSNLGTRSQWLVVFWPVVFRCFSRGDVTVAPILVRELGRRVGIAGQAHDDLELQRLLRAVGDEDCRAFEQTGWLRPLLASLFAAPVFGEQRIWSELQSLRGHLGRCALAEVPAPRHFVEQLAAGVESGSRDEYRALLVQLANRRINSRWSRWTLLRLALVWTDYEAAACATEAIIEAQESKELNERQRTQLRALCSTLLRPRGEPRELAQLRLRVACIRHGWDVLPGLEELLDEFAHTANAKRFGLLLDILVWGFRKGLYAPDVLLNEELPWTPPPYPRLLEKWREAVAICLAEYPEARNEVVERAYRVVSDPTAGIDRLRLFARVLEKATTLKVERALEMVAAFLASPAVHGLGRSATFALSHKLQVAISRLIQACTHEQRRTLVQTVLNIPPVLGASLIHLLCSLHYRELQSDLEALAANPQADDFVRSILLKQSKNRRTDVDSKEYPNLARVLARGLA